MFLSPEYFIKVKNYIHDKGDSVSMNVSSRTDKPYDITYHVLKRNGFEIQVDNSERIYFLKDRMHLGNILFLFGKTVETEIPAGDKKNENEKIVLEEYNSLVAEILKRQK